MIEVPQKPVQILRLKKVLLKTGLSKSALYQKLDIKSSLFDSNFPTQVKLGHSAVGWLEAEVDEWILNCVKASRSELNR